EKPIPVVKFQTVGEISSGRRLRLSGTLEAADTSVLSFQVGGRIAAIHVQAGDAVVTGQLLAELDKTDYENDLKSARAKLSSSRGALKEARENLSRQKQLYAKKLVSASALESAQASFEAAAGNVGVAQSGAKQAEDDLSRTVMSAPFSGTIAARQVDPFLDVSAGQAAFDLQSDVGMEAKVLVPEGMIREVDFGQAVKVTLPTRKGLELGGTVTEIASKANTGNAFDVNVTIGDVAGLDLRPGMTATVIFNFQSYLEGKTIYLIPMSAVSAKEAALSDGSGTPVDRRAPVFLFDEATGTVSKSLVLVGDIRGNSIEVYEGLAPGDQVITAAVSQLYDGKKVRLWTGDY
ncbi:MAG: efflux RND transporter periplasmic adaptor subunit, partial [Parvibaculaceae bacterium]|nr:efflux RND transporter periplasmic adaptor subunit [Parvibaculaceae bacterium]